MRVVTTLETRGRGCEGTSKIGEGIRPACGVVRSEPAAHTHMREGVAPSTKPESFFTGSGAHASSTMTSSARPLAWSRSARVAKLSSAAKEGGIGLPHSWMCKARWRSRMFGVWPTGAYLGGRRVPCEEQ